MYKIVIEKTNKEYFFKALKSAENKQNNLAFKNIDSTIYIFDEKLQKYVLY